jgi:hypothetical protein
VTNFTNYGKKKTRPRGSGAVPALNIFARPDGTIPTFSRLRVISAPPLEFSYRAAAIALDHQRRRAEHAEQFDRRQPEHIALAGLLGLGRFAANEIDHRVVQMA